MSPPSSEAGSELYQHEEPPPSQEKEIMNTWFMRVLSRTLSLSILRN